MPSGYTAEVQDGTITDFATFAMRCARAFGALIEMRDDPLDAEIPDRITPQTRYHDEQLAKANADLKRLEAMNHADRDLAADASWEAHVARIEAYNIRQSEERARYEAMLSQARAWQPPTSNHAGLKDFMIQQLQESIRFDCHEWDVDERPSTSAWWLKQIEEAHRSITYHTKERENAIQRARERTAWIRHLRDSLEHEEAIR